MNADNGSDKTGAHLRDARLARALEHAPDVLEDARPEAQRRAAILRAAHAAVAQAPVTPPPPWWSRCAEWLRAGAGPGRMPWNAALATVLLAGFVTLLWREEPIPSAQIDGPAPAAREEVATPPPAAPAPQVSTELPVPSPDTPAQKASPPPASRPATGAGSVAQKKEKAQAPVLAQQEQAANAAPPVADEAKASAAPAPAVPPSPPAAAAPQRQERARAAAPMAMPAPAMVPAVPADWTHVRRADGASAFTSVARDAAGDLPRLLEALKLAGEAEESPAKQAADGLSAAPIARISLLRDGRVLGGLELSGQRWRFVPEPGSGLLARSGPLTEAEAQTLLAALQRVAP